MKMKMKKCDEKKKRGERWKMEDGRLDTR